MVVSPALPWTIGGGGPFTYKIRLRDSISFDDLLSPDGRLRFIAEGIGNWAYMGMQEALLVVNDGDDDISLEIIGYESEHHIIATIQKFEGTTNIINIVSRLMTLQLARIIDVLDSNYMDDVKMYPQVINDSTPHGLIVFRQRIDKQQITNRELVLMHIKGDNVNYSFPTVNGTYIVVWDGEERVFVSTNALEQGSYCRNIPLGIVENQTDFGEYSSPQINA